MTPFHLPASIAEGLDAAADGLAIWGKDQGLVYANRLFSNLFQIAASGALSYKAFLEATAASHELVLQIPAPLWVEAQSAAFAEEATFEQPMADGRTLEIVNRPTREGGMLTTVHDISNVHNIASALRKAKADAEFSDEAKSRFLRAANHDLRQPLSTLKILIFSCMEESDPEHRKDLLHAMDISVSIMDDLLGALLQIGQLDAGHISARVTTFQLGSLFDRLRIQFAHAAEEKGLTLHIVGTRNAVMSDKALLERILSNLLANAIRYTETGRVLVGCRRRGGHLEIDICDTGRGIAQDHLAKIFDEFFQIPDGRRVKRPGLGLGLNIVKRLADILGHPIIVRSTQGRGSIFGISVPVGDVWRSELAEPEISESKGGEFAGLNVLLIEDDSVLRRATTELLERWGMKPSAVTSIAEACRAVEDASNRPRLIIADYSLTEEFGTDAVLKIRQSLGSAIPAIITTAEVDPQVVDRIKSEGFQVLIKPVSPPRLRVMMHALLFEPGLTATAIHGKAP